MFCALALTVCAIGAAEPIEFTAENFVIIDGQPRLVLGLYENPEDDAVLAEAAAAGFNFFRAKPEPQSLDRLHGHNVYGWIPLGGNMALAEGDATGRANLAELINKFKSHPALLSWEAPDESLWNEYYRASGWIQGGHAREVAERIKEVADAATAKRLRGQLARAVELSHRALWAESEAAYDAIWKELGVEPPHPELRPTQRLEAAKELGDNLTRGWQVIRELDPGHALWQNHAPRNSVPDMRHFNRAVDAAGCDIYPVPANYGTEHSDLRDKTLTSVGAYTRRMQDGAPGKACWMVLQGFGWRDIHDQYNVKEDPRSGRRPNWQETRFMAYDSLLHGATAVLYWGTAYIEKDSELWRDLLRVARELRALEPALVAPKPASEPRAEGELNYASFDGDQPRLMLRQYKDGNGTQYALIAVNELYTGVAFRVSGLPAPLEGRSLYRLYSDEQVTVENGGFRDGIRGYDVQVYATSKALQAE